MEALRNSYNLCWGFSNRIKDDVFREQGGRCACCGRKVDTLEFHHCVPEKALRHGKNAIRGRNVIENCVGLCGPKEVDCHEKADKKAIKERLFWKDGEYVSIREMPPEAYVPIISVDIPNFRKPKHLRRHHR